jgi:hypothetical protein
MTFKTFGISGFHIFAYKFFLVPTTSLKRTVNSRSFRRGSLKCGIFVNDVDHCYHVKLFLEQCLIKCCMLSSVFAPCPDKEGRTEPEIDIP